MIDPWAERREGTSEHDALRRHAFAIAYRMLGSVAEAEDVVQEAMLRLHRTREAGEPIASPRAYVSTLATRLAIDTLRSARARRERYVGDWLPEPVLTGPGPEADPAGAAELADSLSTALLVVLETLTPEQRAVLLLRDVFDYDYEEIGRIVGKREDNVRQIATRARRHVADRRPRFQSTREERRRLAEQFFAAAQEGDLAGLEAVLAEDVTLTGDGGGRVPALARSLRGRDRVARTLLNWMRAGARIPGASIRPAEVNGAPGGLLLDGEGQLLGVWTFEADQGRIRRISSVVNPEKLRHLGPVGDLGEALRSGRG